MAWPCHMTEPQQLLQAARCEWDIRFGDFFGVNNHIYERSWSQILPLDHTDPLSPGWEEEQTIVTFPAPSPPPFGNGENLLSLERQYFYFC